MKESVKKTITIFAVLLIGVLIAIFTEDKGETCLNSYDDNEFIELVKNDILGMDSVEVFVVEVPPASTLAHSLSWVSMFVTKADIHNTYLIYDIQKTRSKTRRFEILTHELIHVAQMESGRLVNMGNGQILWDGSMYNIFRIPYARWPWEMEAYDMQWSVFDQAQDACVDNHSLEKYLLYGRRTSNGNP